MNDSFRTDVFLRYSPENLVCACIYLSARELQIPLPLSPPWWSIFGADEESLIAISIRILNLYSHKTVCLSIFNVKKYKIMIDSIFLLTEKSRWAWENSSWYTWTTNGRKTACSRSGFFISTTNSIYQWKQTRWIVFFI